MRKILRLKVEKRLKYFILKQTAIHLKTFTSEAKMGYHYIFVCKQISIFIERMSEDSICMNVEQYLLLSI